MLINVSLLSLLVLSAAASEVIRPDPCCDKIPRVCLEKTPVDSKLRNAQVAACKAKLVNNPDYASTLTIDYKSLGCKSYFPIKDPETHLDPIKDPKTEYTKEKLKMPSPTEDPMKPKSHGDPKEEFENVKDTSVENDTYKDPKIYGDDCPSDTLEGCISELENMSKFKSKGRNEKIQFVKNCVIEAIKLLTDSSDVKGTSGKKGKDDGDKTDSATENKEYLPTTDKNYIPIIGNGRALNAMSSGESLKIGVVAFALIALLF